MSTLYNIIDNKEHLKQIVMQYGKYAFSSKEIHPDILIHICNCFIDEPFLYKDKFVIGDDYTFYIISGSRNNQKFLKAEQQRYNLNIFFHLFVREFTDNTITDPTMYIGSMEKIQEGGYGAVFPYIDNMGIIDDTKIAKYLTHETGIYYMKMLKYNDSTFAWFIEFCTFVIISSILKYIDCNLIIDKNKRELCINSKYKYIFPGKKTIVIPETVTGTTVTGTTVTGTTVTGTTPTNLHPVDIDSFVDDEYFIPPANHIKVSEIDTNDYFISYSSFISKIHKPFIKKIDSHKYILGYVLEKYDNTMDALYASFKIPSFASNYNIKSTINLTIQIIDILHRFKNLNNIGINISHRDITPLNIMYYLDPLRPDQTSIKLIDFGFMCANIKYKNGKYINFGYHSEEIIPLCDKSYVDIILFIICCIRWYKPFFNDILIGKTSNRYDIYNELKNIITLHDNQILSLIDAYHDHKGKLKYDIKERIYPFILSSYIEKFNKEYTAAKLPLIPNLNLETTENIFNEIFRCFDIFISNSVMTETIIPKNKINYGDIDLFNIADTLPEGQLKQFRDLYETNKKDYLRL